MALATCRECGKPVARSAPLCPSCGGGVPGESKAGIWFLRSVIALPFLAFLLLFATC